MSSSSSVTKNDQLLSRKRFLQSVAVAGTIGAAGLALGEAIIPPVQAGLRGDVDAASYTVDNESGTFHAYGGSPSLTDISGLDASAVINSALGTLTSGGSVYIREGTYNLSSSLLVNNSNILLKMSKGAWLKPSPNLTSDVININGDDVIIDSINIDAYGSAVTGALVRLGSTSESQRCIVYNCDLKSPTYHGIRLDAFTGVCFVYSNRIQTGASLGVGILVQGADHHIFHNDVGGFQPLPGNPLPSPIDAGITCSGAGDVTIQGNQVYSSGVGIDVYASNDIRILGNNIEGNWQQGIRVYTDSQYTVRRFTINNNTIFDNGQHPATPSQSVGIHLTGSAPLLDLTLLGNIINDARSPPSQNYGIRLENSQMNNFIISENILSPNATTTGLSLVSYGGTNIIFNNLGA